MEGLIEARRAVPHLVLAAPEQSAGEWSEVVGQVEFDYGVARVPASDRRPLLPTGRGVLRRYFEVEESLVARATALGARRVAEGTLALPLDDLPRLVAELGASEWVVEGEGSRWRRLGTPRMKLANGAQGSCLSGLQEPADGVVGGVLLGRRVLLVGVGAEHPANGAQDPRLPGFQEPAEGVIGGLARG